MDIDKSGLKSDDNNDIICLGDNPEGLENDDSSICISNDVSGGSDDRNVGTGFREPDSSQDPRLHSFWGRGYGPHGPHGPHGPPIHQRPPREHVNAGFLIKCGIIKSTLKGLPDILLNLLEPEYCGVCAMSFDNLDSARAHYTSKNHCKNQKRWLVLQAKVGSQHPKEIPMRARELYCELCDIYITSKSHAESHYAGRSHHAIVAGRRVLKNPFLLQANMRGRVEQLIRREKKFLKNNNKTAANEKAKKQIKLTSPELYCDICQTSVTTMEQMTMHLNGKKHLKNEKNHIFKMMEDGIIESKPAETPGTHKEADGQGVLANEDFDWGDGSGPWDDDPQ